MESILENLGAWLQTLPEVGRGGGVLRYVVPLLAILIVARCAVSLLTFRREAEVWAWLTTQAGDRIPVTHWENLLGRGRGSDVLLEYPTISRTHAVLTRYDDGSWSIFDCRSLRRNGLRARSKASCFLSALPACRSMAAAGSGRETVSCTGGFGGCAGGGAGGGMRGTAASCGAAASG